LGRPVDIPSFTWLPQDHLPKVPDKFVDLALAKTKSGRLKPLMAPFDRNSRPALDWNMVGTPGYKRIITVDNQQVQSRWVDGFELGQEWECWVKQNIIQNFIKTTARSIVGNIQTLGAHIDNPGKLRFFYLLETGGDDVQTVFYKLPDKDFIFNHQFTDTAHAIHYNDTSELVEIQKLKVEPCRWILYNGYVIHSVENIQSPRIFLDIIVRPEDIDISIKCKQDTITKNHP